MFGLEDFVAFIELSKESTYHLQGIAKLCKVDVKKCCAIMACSSGVADSAMALTFEDDRLPLHAQRIIDGM